MPLDAANRPASPAPLPAERRRLLGALLGAALAARPGLVRADPPQLRIVTSDKGEATRRIVEALGRRHPDAPASPDARALASKSGRAVYLAIGPAALQTALEADVPGPLISAFVSSHAYAAIVERYGRARTRPLTAIYAEAAPRCQMELIRALYGRRVLVGVLLSNATASLAPSLNDAAREVGLDIAVRTVLPDENPARALAALGAIQVLLALPDPDLYSAQTLRPLLESTYRRGQGMIGFSTALVSAGTLAAAYSSIDDTVAQLHDTIAAMAGGRSLEPRYPIYWRVMINEAVARSLDVLVEPNARSLGHFPP